MSVLSYAMMILLMMFISFSLDFKPKKWYIEATVEYFSYIAIAVALGIGYINDYIILPNILLFGLCYWKLRENRVRMDRLQSEIVFLVGNELKEVIRGKREKE